MRGPLGLASAVSPLTLWTRFGTLLFLSLTLSITGPLLAQGNRKSLFKNGVYAAAYGDLTIDKGDWDGETISALRLKGGFQLMRYEFISLGLGYQKSGFYTANRNWNRSEGTTALDFRGPFLELHIVPEGLFSGSLAFSSNDGYLFRKELDPAAYGYAGCDGGLCTIVLQRSKLTVQEMVLHFNLRIADELHLTAGFGTRNMSGRAAYEVYTSDPALSYHQGDPDGKWKNTESFYLIGLRGSQL